MKGKNMQEHIDKQDKEFIDDEGKWKSLKCGITNNIIGYILIEPSEKALNEMDKKTQMLNKERQEQEEIEAKKKNALEKLTKVEQELKDLKETLNQLKNEKRVEK